MKNGYLKGEKTVKKLMSFVLAFVLFLTSTMSVWAAGVIQPRQPDDNLPLYSQGQSHSYDAGIVDGGVYRLRNVSFNVYLDVQGASSASGANMIIHPEYHGGVNQQFVVSYLGFGVYELSPVEYDTVLHVEGNNLQSRTKNRTDQQKFKIKMISGNTGVIYTMASNFTKAICYDGNTARLVTQATYDSLEYQSDAEWVFERINDTVYDNYHMYYLRNLNTGLYLDVQGESVANGALLHSHPFLGQANQEWKLVYDEDLAHCYLKPGHRRDMALDVSGTHVSIKNDGNASAQGFLLTAVGTDDAGKKTYRISTTGQSTTKYLNMGQPLTNDDNYCYIEAGTNADDLWVLERVCVDGHDIRPLTVNTWRNDTVGNGYNEKRYLVFRSEVDSRYKVEIQGTNAAIFEAESTSSYESRLDAYPYGNLYVLDVFFRAGKIYYIPVLNNGYTDTSYSIRVRQFTATYHSAPTDSDNLDFTRDIDQIMPYSQSMNFNITHRENMTTTAARGGVNVLTGYGDFKSEIFCYSGHGAKGVALYDRDNFFGDSSRFLSSYLPRDMSNCELIIWACCYSACDGQDSLVKKSIDNGAKTAIGWKWGTTDLFMPIYMEWFFNSLSSGKTVQQASQIAKDKVTIFANALYENSSSEDYRNEVLEHLNRTVGGTVVSGNEDNVIFPVSEDMSSCEFYAESLTASVNKAEYTLIMENETTEVKLYAKIINGEVTSDWFAEYYKDGVLIQTKKYGEHIALAEVR